MLVVDAYALQTINVLYFGGDVLGQLRDTQQTQDIVRVAWAIGDHLTLLDRLAFEHGDLTPFRDQRLERIARLRRNRQTTLTFGLFTEAHHTADFRQNGRLFGFTRFEQVSHAGQTTGDVLVTRRLDRYTRNDLTYTDGRTVVHRDNGVTR